MEDEFEEDKSRNKVTVRVQVGDKRDENKTVERREEAKKNGKPQTWLIGWGYGYGR